VDDGQLFPNLGLLTIWQLAPFNHYNGVYEDNPGFRPSSMSASPRMRRFEFFVK